LRLLPGIIGWPSRATTAAISGSALSGSIDPAPTCTPSTMRSHTSSTASGSGGSAVKATGVG